MIDQPLRRALLWSAGLALAVRLVAFAQEVSAPYLGSPVLDERWYDGAARTLLGWPGGIALDGFRPLLYPGVLALIYGALGPEWGRVGAVAVQHLLGAVTGSLVVLLARRLAGSDVAALAAGMLWALAAPPIFTEGQLLSETLFVFLCTAALVAMLGTGSVRRGALAGALIGLAGQVRPSGLILGGVLVWLAWRASGEAPGPSRAGVGSSRGMRGSRIAPALAGLSCLAVVHLAAMTIQAPVNGGFRLLPSSGGVNLYLGNERGADGMLPRQDAPAPAGVTYRDSVEAWAEREVRTAHPAAERVDPGTTGRYWLRRTLHDIAACPSCWARLMARKVVILFWNEEIPNHLSFAFAAREELPLLGWLPVRWWLLLALGPLGAIWVRQRTPVARHGVAPRHLPTCAVFLFVLAVGIVAFFVNGRYRLPLWPPLVALAGCGAAALIEWSRVGKRRRLIPAAAVAVAGALLALVNWTGAAPPSAARDLFFRSLARLEGGDLGAAMADARASVELEPADAAAQVQLGNCALALGQVVNASTAYRAAVALDAAQPIAWNNLGVALERSGDLDGALEAYGRAAFLDGAYPLDGTAIERLRRVLASRRGSPAAPSGAPRRRR